MERSIKRRFSAIAITLSLVLGAVVIASFLDDQTRLFNDGATASTPTIVMSSDNNRFFNSGSSDTSKSGTGTLNSEQGTPLIFGYSGFSGTISSSSWHTVHSASSSGSSVSGRFYNTDKITDLTSISITSETAGSIGVYWSGTEAFSDSTDVSSVETDCEIHAFTANSSYTFTFNDDHPNYFMVTNSNGSTDTNSGAMTITNATVVFGCQTDYYHSLTVTSENEVAGTVSGSGYYCAGKDVTVVATSNDGYHFLGWYNGDNQVSTSSSYTFSMPADSYSLIARFEEWEEVKFISDASTVLNALPSDFAYGMDMSEVYELEDLGANYTDKDGNAIDVFEIIKAAGVNSVRFRLWVDPFSANSGLSYGGGSNSLDVDLAMAKRAYDAGLNICIDFHLSDIYTDPDTQIAPKSWTSASAYGTNTYNHVYDSLNAFKSAGITVSSVQIGNETVSYVCGRAITNSSGTMNDSAKTIFQNGLNAAKAVFSDITTIIHVTADYNTDRGTSRTFYLPFINAGLTNLDVIGFSYYPYYHGASVGISNLTTQLNAVAEAGYDVMVMETAWGYTDAWTEDTNNTFYTTNDSTSTANVTDCGYDTSTQAQTTELYDIIKVLSELPNNHGKGIYYWGADWYPVSGTQWISKTGMYYAEVNPGTDYPVTDTQKEPADDDTYTLGDTTTTYKNGCKATWANQALFDYDGQALPSLYTYKNFKDNDNLVSTDTVVGPYYGTGNLEYTCSLDEVSSLSLPTTVTCATELGRKVDGTVTWTLPTITEDGDYVATGTVTSSTYSGTISADIHVVTNVLTDGGFEGQTSGSAITNSTTSPWDITTSNTTVAATTSNVRSGSLAAEFYGGNSSAADTFTLSQTVTISDTGYYDFEIYARGIANTNVYDGAGSAIYLYYQIGTETAVVDTANPLLDFTTVNTSYTLYTLSDIYVEEGDELTVGVQGSLYWNNAYGAFDDAVLRETLPTGFRDGSFENQEAGSTFSSPWTVTNNGMDRVQIEEGTNLLVDTTASSAKYLEFYTSVAASFTLTQTFTIAEASLYQLTFYNRLSWISSTENYYSSFSITVAGDGWTFTEDDYPSWPFWNNANGQLIEALTFNAQAREEITITLDISLKAGAWGCMDEFAVKPYTAS